MSDESQLNETYLKLAEAIEWGDEDEAHALAQQALDEGYDPAEIIKEAMSLGVRRAGDRFNEGEFFLPELKMSRHLSERPKPIPQPDLFSPACF